MSSEEFCSRLDTFFSQLPKDFRYAVEIRNADLLGPGYRKVLEHHGVGHVYDHWSYMPSLREQHHRMEECFTAPFTVVGRARLVVPCRSRSFTCLAVFAPQYGAALLKRSVIRFWLGGSRNPISCTLFVLRSNLRRPLNQRDHRPSFPECHWFGCVALRFEMLY